MIEQLTNRFASAARGRNVAVDYIDGQYAYFAEYDYAANFEVESSTFRIYLTERGCFEGAYRCIYRWIEAKAEQLDGINSVPTGYVDARCIMDWWRVEEIYRQHRSDLNSAFADKVSSLERDRPDEFVHGKIKVEARVSALNGFLAYMQRKDLHRTDAEVDRGVLSPETVDLLKTLGFSFL